MAASVGAPSIVAEITRTSGLNPYVVSGGVARAARFAQFYSVGDTFDYFCDDGGGRAEYGLGQLNADGSITRLAIHWTTSGGIGGLPVNWPAIGRRFLRAVLSAFGGGGGPFGSSARTISGFRNGTVPALEKIERYLFVESGVLRSGLPGSKAIADVPTSATVANIVTETGDIVVDGLGGTLTTAAGGNLVVNNLGDQIVTETGDLVVDALFGGGSPISIDIRKNGTNIGSMIFNPGVSQASFSFPNNVTFAAGDLFELVAPTTSDPNLANLVWTFLI
jgi:hypothetical protein